MNKRYTFIAFLPIIVVVAVIILSWRGVVGEMQQVSGRTATTQVKPLPSFSVPLLNKKTLWQSDALRGRYVLINLFASWCLPCRAEHPLLMQLSQGKRLAVVGIAWKDTPENIQRLLQQDGNPYEQVAIDSKGEATIALGATGVPESFLVDPAGNVIYHFAGPLDKTRIETEILPLVEQKK